ncbi:hypothetical protein [Pedobacter sp. P26]|uniref:hypothetical protein n=1 Tax=Pedobacter sp. P26 TaxID=3423956 RepID=UPI003D6708EF
MFRSLSLLATCCLFFSCFFFSSCEKEGITKIDTLRIIDTLDIDRPINLKATKGVYGSRITVSWTPMPLAQKYQLFKFNDVTQKYVLLKELTDTTFDDSVISKSLTKNFYKVRTYNSATSFSRFSDADFGYTSASSYYKALTFGSEGSGASQFNFNMHIEVDKTGNIYVSDEGLNRVLKFSSTGSFIEQFYSGSAARAVAFLVMEIISQPVHKAIVMFKYLIRTNN